MNSANPSLKALAGVIWAVGAAQASGHTLVHCKPLDPAGYFTGVGTSQQSGRFDVSLNLRCANGRYEGEIVSSLGSFGITGGSADSNRLHIEFAIGTESGSIDAVFNRDTLQG